MLKRRLKLLSAWLALWLGVSALNHPAAAQAPVNRGDPAAVALAYLRALYARDFAEAYRYVSAADRRAKSLNQYLRQRGAFSGFALETGRKLAAQVDAETTQTPVAADRSVVTARYRAPDPAKLSGLLRDWSGYQLNALAPAERQRISQRIEQQTRDGTLEMIAGTEKLTLVKEASEWRVFLDWAAGVAIPFRTVMPESGGGAILEVTLSRQRVITQPGEVFDIVLKIRNRTAQPIVARIGHIVEPKALADYLEFVQCGFLLPVKLEAGREQEYSGTYLLRGSFPEGVRELSLSYDFKLSQAN